MVLSLINENLVSVAFQASKNKVVIVPLSPKNGFVPCSIFGNMVPVTWLSISSKEEFTPFAIVLKRASIVPDSPKVSSHPLINLGNAAPSPSRDWLIICIQTSADFASKLSKDCWADIVKSSISFEALELYSVVFPLNSLKISVKLPRFCSEIVVSASTNSLYVSIIVSPYSSLELLIKTPNWPNTSCIRFFCSSAPSPVSITISTKVSFVFKAVSIAIS